MHDRDSVCPWCVNDRVFAGETVRWEMLSPKDNRWYYVVNVPVYKANGSISKYSMIMDITDRKRVEEALRESEAQLKQKQKMLEELNRTLEKRVHEEVEKNRGKDIILIQQNRQAALGEMFDHIAHQWKQPLNSIAVIIQALGSISAHEQVTSKDILETVDNIMDMVAHMAQTVDVFRNFYKPDKERSAFLVKDSIDKALTFVMPVFRRYGIEVDLDADAQLSAFGYPKEYAQVLLNILANAKDAFAERGVKNPRISIKAFADGDNTVVTITDNAGGIPDESIETIFDLYFTTKESSGGTGIGLYMSKNIIEKNMGGILTISNIDNGAQFRIELGKS
jgi:C4-dicarboxylate-specific signal transduction histidine kinase